MLSLFKNCSDIFNCTGCTRQTCECHRDVCTCVNRFDNYNVFIYGSWNNWSEPIKATYEKSDWFIDRSGYKDWTYNRYEAILPGNLKNGTYEYKWKFVNKCTKTSFWILNPKRPIKRNEGWNDNNIYVVTKSKNKN